MAAPKITVEISNRQKSLTVDKARLRKVVRAVMADTEITQAAISVGIVDDPTIHKLNREFLQHDYATDVLSFALEDAPDAFEGEIIMSADTAIAEAKKYGWTPGDELLLYVIHGSLHLAGYDDTTPKAKREMRAAEKKYLKLFGLERK